MTKIKIALVINKLRIMKRGGFFVFFILLTQSISAQNLVNLVCISPVDNFTLDLVLDEKNNYVTLGGNKVTAEYTGNTISFRVKFDNESYFHVLNRNNGSLMIQRERDKFILTTHQCTVSTRKF